MLNNNKLYRILNRSSEFFILKLNLRFSSFISRSKFFLCYVLKNVTIFWTKPYTWSAFWWGYYWFDVIDWMKSLLVFQFADSVTNHIFPQLVILLGNLQFCVVKFIEFSHYQLLQAVYISMFIACKLYR